MSIDLKRAEHLFRLAEEHLTDVVVDDLHEYWDGLAEDGEITDDELVWIQDNVSVTVTVRRDAHQCDMRVFDNIHVTGNITVDAHGVLVYVNKDKE